MNDSQKRIAAYKSLLPGLKEKVAAVAILLAMSATMFVTVTFAWVALSTNPEVKGVNTTVASNGNLEIALVGPEGNIPEASKVGDSNLALIDRNITWGNLINLSDPLYGLDQMTLRPAILNTSDLLNSPLYGAIYSEDGRVQQLSSDFAFATWDESGEFIIPDTQKYGVRAIASTKLESSNAGVIKYRGLRSAVVNMNATAGNAYLDLMSNQSWVNSLATVMGHYMTARMNSDDATVGNPEVDQKDIQNLKDLFNALLAAFRVEEQALVSLANLQLYAINGEGNYVEYTAETLRANADNISNQGLQITSLSQFYKDLDCMILNAGRLEQISTAGTIKWNDSFTNEAGETFTVNQIVADIVDVGKCTVDGTPISSIGASNAMGYLSGTHSAVITNGIIMRFEQRVGAYMSVKGVSITAKIKRLGMTVPGTVTANITTSAIAPSLFSQDVKIADENNTGEIILKAKDTYGLAVDLWVKTNAEGNFLTLEGNVLTKTETVRDTRVINGETYELYSYTITYTDEASGESLSDTYVLYKDGDVWYDAEAVAPFNYEDYVGEDGTFDPKEKWVEIETVIGYEGDNRIWDSSVGLSVNSTTQGSGSCYVYYADTPEDQARSLKLLQYLKVAFVDAEGNLLTTATLDTERFYSENGKVIVPLTLGADSINLGEDINGIERYGITGLEKNVATRITALVYLEGVNLSNSDVLSSADIQGQLNIQFGSSVDLNHFENEELREQVLTLSASVDKTSFNYDEASEGNPMTTNVTVKVDGTQPKKMTAFFLRSINATQGSREAEMTFTYDEASKSWKASHTFLVPGNYILRSVELDGISYDLPADSCPKVTIEGFTVTKLNWPYASSTATFMTADSTISTDLSLEFASHDVDKMPKTVVGRFIRTEDGSVTNVEFTYNPTTFTWNGPVTFRTSGNYTLQYLVLDGEYQEIPENLRKYATVYIGMKVAVYTDSPQNFMFEANMPDNQNNLYMKVIIMDDTGNALPGLSGAKLYFKSRSSSLEGRGLNTDLTWNGSTGYYTGTFKSQVGMYDFLRVDVSNDTTSNSITNATTSPSFIIQSPTPPEFISDTSTAYQYAPEGSGSAELVTILDENAAALSYIKAVLMKDGVEYDTLVDGEPKGQNADGTYNWAFKIPSDENGMQDGTWSIKEIHIADIGTYTPEAPLVFDLTGKAVESYVVSQIFVTFNRNDAITFDGEFMEEHTLSPVGISITDINGNALRNVTNVKAVYTHALGTMLQHGGYTIDTTTNTTYKSDIEMSFASSDGKSFTQDGTTTLRYAGVYSLSKLEFTFGDGKTFTASYTGTSLPAASTYTVKSTAPTVAITASSPSGGSTIDADTSGKGSGHASVTVPARTSTEATVYFSCSTSSGCGSTYHNYTQPSVTITLSNIGKATKANLDFGSGVHVYNGSTQVTGYEWTANGACSRNIGYYKSRSAATDDKTPAGTITASTLVLTVGNETFTVTLKTPITINNPY